MNREAPSCDSAAMTSIPQLHKTAPASSAIAYPLPSCPTD